MRPGSSCTCWCSEPPERHVELLQPTADAQHRYAAGNSPADQRQRGGVACRVRLVALAGRRAVIVAGIDVGRAAGDHQAVQRPQQTVWIEPLAQGGNQHRERGRSDHHCVDVFVADAVEVDLVARLQAGGDPDQRGWGRVAHDRSDIARLHHGEQAGALDGRMQKRGLAPPLRHDRSSAPLRCPDGAGDRLGPSAPPSRRRCPR